jgi:UDP-N-acetyl-2-amino-2-deoxyglucuronate dehydrogenase
LNVRVGLIGAGNISATHARAAAAIDGVSVAAVYGPTRGHAETLAALHGAVAYDSLDGFLSHKPLDIVIVGSPSGRHAEHALAAAKSGRHVLVEKPLDISTERVDALLAETNRLGVAVGVIFQDRLKPHICRSKQIVDQGRLGQPVIATAQVKWYRPPEYYASSRWRGTRAMDGGGALMNQAIHTVDLLIWLFGPVRHVSARTATRVHAIEVEDTAVATLEFASGALGSLEATTSAYPGYSRRLELTGSEGTLRIEGDELTAIDLRDAPAFKPSPPASRPTESSASPVVSDASAHSRVIRDFIDAIEKGRSPVCNGPEGRKSVALVEAIYRSAEQKRPIDLS